MLPMWNTDFYFTEKKLKIKNLHSTDKAWIISLKF